MVKGALGMFGRYSALCESYNLELLMRWDLDVLDTFCQALCVAHLATTFAYQWIADQEIPRSLKPLTEAPAIVLAMEQLFTRIMVRRMPHSFQQPERQQ